MVRRIDGVTAIGSRPQAQAVKQRLLRVERTRAARVFRLVGTYGRSAGGVKIPHALGLSVDEMQAAAGSHSARHHPARVRNDDESLGVLDTADERQPTRWRAWLLG